MFGVCLPSLSPYCLRSTKLTGSATHQRAIEDGDRLLVAPSVSPGSFVEWIQSPRVATEVPGRFKSVARSGGLQPRGRLIPGLTAGTANMPAPTALVVAHIQHFLH